MKERKVIFAPEAAQDLVKIYDWIGHHATPALAMSYMSALRRSVSGFVSHPRAEPFVPTSVQA